MYFRLFKHAMALAPRSPDVLNSYGEFLEESRKVGGAFRLRVKYNRHFTRNAPTCKQTV